MHILGTVAYRNLILQNSRKPIPEFYRDTDNKNWCGWICLIISPILHFDNCTCQAHMNRYLQTYTCTYLCTCMYIYMYVSFFHDKMCCIYLYICVLYLFYKQITKNLSNSALKKRRKHRNEVCFKLTKLVKRITHKFLITEVRKQIYSLVLLVAEFPM